MIRYIKIALAAFALAVFLGPWPVRVAAGLVALFCAWITGVMDGHEHLRRKNPEAYQAFR